MEKTNVFKLRSAIPVSTIAADFSRHHRAQVPNLLTTDSAESLYIVMTREVPWQTTWRIDDDFAVLDARADVLEKSDVRARTNQAASEGKFALEYERYSLAESYLEKGKGILPGMLELLNSEEFIALVRAITGNTKIVAANAYATFIEPGQFLGRHDDDFVQDGWTTAFVLNLTKDWRPDWGGYLNFFDDDGNIQAGHMPRFNTLSLFKAPTSHAVSYVPPFAPRGRFAISGWLLESNT